MKMQFGTRRQHLSQQNNNRMFAEKTTFFLQIPSSHLPFAAAVKHEE